MVKRHAIRISKGLSSVFMNVSGSLVSFMRVGNVVGQQDMLQVNSQILG